MVHTSHTSLRNWCSPYCSCTLAYMLSLLWQTPFFRQRLKGPRHADLVSLSLVGHLSDPSRQYLEIAGFTPTQWGLKSDVGVPIVLHFFTTWVLLPSMCLYSFKIIDVCNIVLHLPYHLVRISTSSMLSSIICILNWLSAILLSLYLLAVSL